jgi:adenine-specific DNA-methyltransferase
MIVPRLNLMKEFVSERGSIFVHIDSHVGHYVKVLMDEIFGKGNFVNEIIWQRISSHNDGKQFGKVHDTIFWYKRANAIYNIQVRNVEIDEIAKKFPKIDDKGNRYFLGNLSAAGQGPARSPRLA